MPHSDASEDTQRLFVGLPVRAGPALRSLLAQLDGLGRAVRPAPSDQLHLTLKFLGEVAVGSIASVREALDEVGGSTAPFEWSIRGRGAFPNRSRPRVLWAGCEPASPLIQLAGTIEDRLAARGFKKDRQPFRPHLTLARVRGPAPDLTAFLDDDSGEVLAHESTRQVTLFRSILQRGPAIHQPIHSSTLNGH